MARIIIEGRGVPAGESADKLFPISVKMEEGEVRKYRLGKQWGDLEVGLTPDGHMEWLATGCQLDVDDQGIEAQRGVAYARTSRPHWLTAYLGAKIPDNIWGETGGKLEVTYLPKEGEVVQRPEQVRMDDVHGIVRAMAVIFSPGKDRGIEEVSYLEAIKDISTADGGLDRRMQLDIPLDADGSRRLQVLNYGNSFSFHTESAGQTDYPWDPLAVRDTGVNVLVSRPIGVLNMPVFDLKLPDARLWGDGHHVLALARYTISGGLSGVAMVKWCPPGSTSQLPPPTTNQFLNEFVNFAEQAESSLKLQNQPLLLLER